MATDKDYVFVSPYKGGSTSVGKALVLLGYTDMGWAPNLFAEGEIALIGTLNTFIESSYASFGDIPDAIKQYVKESVGDLLSRKMADGNFNCSCDYPMGHECIHPYIRKIVFPSCKFIFLAREKESYLKSVESHQLQLYSEQLTVEAIWKCNRELGRLITWSNYCTWKRHYDDLKRHFPEDVLIMDVQEGWKPLLRFLHMDEVPFPWENKAAPSRSSQQ